MSVRIGSYEVVESLGSGGMGEVFKAWDPRLKRHVAIKLLHRNLCRLDSARRRFEREIRAMISLDHPNVVKVYDMQMGSQVSWYAMEYVEGADLARRLDEGVRFTWERGIHVVAQVLDALSYVHGQGMLHRDVKPHNVLLGDNDRVHLMDFGLVKDGDRSDLTQAGQVLGSLRYLAPEVADGGPSSVGSDLYQVGLLTSCLLSGRLPFHEASTARELVRAIHSGMPPCPESGVAGPIPPPLRQWLDTMVALRPENRFPDGPTAARALAQAGKSLLSLSSIALLRPLLEHSGERRLLPKGRRRPGWKALLLLPALLGALALYGRFARRPPLPTLEGLTLVCRPRSLQLRWRCSQSAPLTVIFGPEGHEDERRARSTLSEGTHRCTLDALSPATRHAFRIVFPDGRTSLRRPFRTPPLRKVRILSERRGAVGLRSLALTFDCDAATPARLVLKRRGKLEELPVSPRAQRRHRIVLDEIEPDEEISELRLRLDETEIALAPVAGIALRSRRLSQSLRALQGADRAGRIFRDLEGGRAEEARRGLDLIRKSEAWERLEAFASASNAFFRAPSIALADKNTLYLALAELEAVDAAFWTKGHAGGLDLARFYASWVHLRHAPLGEEGRSLFDGFKTRTILRPHDMPTTWAEGIILSEMAEEGIGKHQTLEELKLRVRVEAKELEGHRHALLAAALTNLDPAQELRVDFADRGTVVLRHDQKSFPGLTTDSTEAYRNWTVDEMTKMAPCIVARLSSELLHPGVNELSLRVQSCPGLKGLGMRLQLISLRLAFE